jgi:hypothetical protein
VPLFSRAWHAPATVCCRLAMMDSRPCIFKLSTSHQQQQQQQQQLQHKQE